MDIAYAYAGADGLVVNALAGGRRWHCGRRPGRGQFLPEFMAALKKAQGRGIPVVIATQTGNGRVMRSRRFVEDGYIAADNLAPKKARILLMLALTRTRDAGEIQRMMLTY